MISNAAPDEASRESYHLIGPSSACAESRGAGSDSRPMNRYCQVSYWHSIAVAAIFVMPWHTAQSAPRQHGFVSRAFHDELGVEHNYLVFSPVSGDERNEKFPVILFLNGFNENGQDGIRQIRNNFGLQIWEMEAWFPFLAVIPQCSEGADWSLGGKDAEWTLQILDEAIREFGGDPNRVILTGVSAGGSGVWKIGSAYPERFAALVPLCGSSLPNVAKLSDAGMPVWNFYNDKDRPELVEANRMIRDRLIGSGLSPMVSEFDAQGHDCWNQAWRMHALYGWMLQQNRKNNRPAKSYSQHPPLEVAARWKEVGDGSWNPAGEFELLGRALATESILVSDFSDQELEFHADFWFSRSSFQLMVTSASESSRAEKSLRIHVPSVSSGIGGIVVEGERQWLCELDPAAQHWLREDAWNEARLSLQEGRLTLLLNGWQAADVVIPGFDVSDSYRVALVAPAGGETRVRYLRHRIIPGQE